MLDAAATIIVGSRHTEGEIPARYGGKVHYIPENAIDPTRFNKVAGQNTEGQLRAVFIGRLVPYKGPDMLLEAASDLMREGRLHLDIIGDGPMRADLEALAERLSLGASVTFHGAVPHAQVQDIAVRSNLLTFPSIREFGGGVVLEAMALGVVPVVVDYAGPGELVTLETGYKVPIGNRAQVTEGLRLTLEAICADPSALPGMAKAARERVLTQFTWSAKAGQIAKIYQTALERRSLD
jgi:glycosyltransferase involved in cell wall biosynthesis